MIREKDIHGSKHKLEIDSRYDMMDMRKATSSADFNFGKFRLDSGW